MFQGYSHCMIDEAIKPQEISVLFVLKFRSPNLLGRGREKLGFVPRITVSAYGFVEA